MSAVAVPAAGTGVGRPHQGDGAGEAGSAARGAEPDLALFQRLAELVQNGPGKFGHFIEKQDSRMGQAQFTGAGMETASKQGGGGTAMVGARKGRWRY